MAFFNSAVNVLQTLVIALGAGLGIWGVINLLEGYGNDNPEAEKAGQITEVEGSAEIFNVNGDVNYTGLVDINDAQLVYNIYNAKYDSFDTTTMKMFLAADMNKDREVSALDAAAVVGLIK